MNKTRMNIFFILIKKQKVILFGESPGQVLIPPTILVWYSSHSRHITSV